ncbi:MAG: hypothetical protein AAF664_17440, partial [Planctomycetota bacterium]
MSRIEERSDASGPSEHRPEASYASPSGSCTDNQSVENPHLSRIEERSDESGPSEHRPEASYAS